MTRKTALITGGSAGIGAAVARMLVDSDWDVTLTARSQDRLDRAAAELGSEVFTVAANLADPDAPARIAQAHLDRFGGVDLLVNNAGVGMVGPIADKTAKTLELEMSLNFRSAYLLLQSCIPALRASARVHGKSTVINVSSLAARQNPPNGSVYAATKAALVSLSASAHAELSRDGVQVTALLPGFVDTPGTSWTDEQTRTVMMSAADVAEAVRFVLSTSDRCFVPEIVLTTAGPGLLWSPVDWETSST